MAFTEDRLGTVRDAWNAVNTQTNQPPANQNMPGWWVPPPGWVESLPPGWTQGMPGKPYEVRMPLPEDNKRHIVTHPLPPNPGPSWGGGGISGGSGIAGGQPNLTIREPNSAEELINALFAAKEEAYLALSSALQSNLSGLAQAEAEANATLATQRAKLETAYRNDVAQAIADGNLARAQALLNDFVRVDDMLVNMSRHQADMNMRAWRANLDAAFAMMRMSG